MQNRNKHHYTVDEHILPGKIRVMYVKHRSLHSWGFIVLTLLWLLFSISLFCLIWNEASKLLFGTSCILFFLYCLLVAAWSKIVAYMNLCLERKIVYPIVDRLLAKSTKLSSRKNRVKRRKLICIDDWTKDYPDESVVVFFNDGSSCEYPFRFMAEKNKGNVIVKSLSLTHYVCKNERRITEARSWLPELSLNNWLKLASCVILFIGFASFCIFTVMPPKIFFTIIFSVICVGILFLYLYQKLKSHKRKNTTLNLAILKAMEFSIGTIDLFTTLNLPFLALFIVTIISIISTTFPIYAIIFLINKIAIGLISKSTEYFIILVLSSFILVYCPSYIKRIICKTPFVAHTEGKRVKRRLADLMIYIYDAGAVEFLLNVAYVVFFCLICIRKFQYSDSLFSKEIDEVILNAFIVFLSFEGVRSSYKRIHISAKLFFQKILNLLDT